MAEHISAVWQEYRRKVIATDAPEIQLVETRRAFYGGAAALLSIMMLKLERNDRDEPTPADLHMMDEIEAEFVRFSAEVGTAMERSKARTW